VAEKIKALLDQIYSIIPKMTLSMGYVSRRANFQASPDSLILSAQQALQQAQASGGNQIVSID
jgi:PleD family two-component response regulator